MDLTEIARVLGELQATVSTLREEQVALAARFEEHVASNVGDFESVRNDIRFAGERIDSAHERVAELIRDLEEGADLVEAQEAAAEATRAAEEAAAAAALAAAALEAETEEEEEAEEVEEEEEHEPEHHEPEPRKRTFVHSLWGHKGE
jgi:ribosomal protein L12E/L44/L45/RPP1/RPP2